MKVGRFYMKDRITIADMEACEGYLIAARGAKVESEAKYYLKRMFRLLTTARWVFRWDYKAIDKILAAAGFVGNKSELTEENAIINLTSWIAANQGGMTPQMVAQSMTPMETTPFLKAIGRKILDDSIRMLRAHHSPVEFSKELEKRAEALEEKRRAALPPMKQGKTMGHIMADMYKG